LPVSFDANIRKSACLRNRANVRIGPLVSRSDALGAPDQR
jgi:hypothetical protein